MGLQVGLNWWMACMALLALLLARAAAQAIYNLYFHPLRRFPGPVSYRASRWPWSLRLWAGDLSHHLLSLHGRYGDVVRVAPDELSFTHEAAWGDIYGHRVGARLGAAELPKSPRFYRPHASLGRSIINADRGLHGLLRRALAHGFSERSMRAQEGIIRRYVDLLIRRLREKCPAATTTAAAAPPPVDLSSWYNWTTFDLIGDLSMGGSFGCLDRAEYHPWVYAVAEMPREAMFPIGLRMLGLDALVSLLVRFGVKARKRTMQYIEEQLARREGMGAAQRPDLVQGLLGKKAQGDIDSETLHGVSSTLIVAGSETTATLLSGATYLLLKHPGALRRLQAEVRSAFGSEDDITFSSCQQLPYMLACLNEALRMYPPVPVGLPREVPAGGAVIADEMLPEGTVVAVPQYAMYRSPRHWTKPDEFHPERFLGEPEFAADHFDTLQPFSAGPRNCIGRNLAYAEMRLILARVVYNFDMRLAPESDGWMETQRAYLLWKKPPLRVHLTPHGSRGSFQD